MSIHELMFLNDQCMTLKNPTQFKAVFHMQNRLMDALLSQERMIDSTLLCLT